MLERLLTEKSLQILFFVCIPLTLALIIGVVIRLYIDAKERAKRRTGPHS